MKSASAFRESRWICKISPLLLSLLFTASMSGETVFVANAFSATVPPPPNPAAPSATTKHHPTDWLVVDFDGTCTVRDTISVLPRLAALAQSRVPQTNSGKQSNFPTDDVLSPDAAIDFQGRLSIFSMLENEYFKRYIEVQESIQSTMTTAADAGSRQEGADRLEQLAASLDKLDDVSTEITHEVSRWRVLGGLGGISHTDLREIIDLYKERQDELEPGTGNAPERRAKLDQVLESFSLKTGCLSVLRRSAIRNFGIGILSINWCPALIESILVQPLCSADESLEEQQPSFDDVEIWSNSVDAEGIVALPFPGAISKRDQILRLQQQQQQQNHGRVVYVGDSSTDLLAILQADVGILLGGSTSATSLAMKFGVSVKPLCDYDKDARDGDAVVWKANNWNEIGSFLNQTSRRTDNSR